MGTDFLDKRRMKAEIELGVSGSKEVDEVTAIEDMRVTRKASWNRDVLDDVVVSFGHPARYSMFAARGFGVGAGPNVLADVRAARLDGFPETLQCHLLSHHMTNIAKMMPKTPFHSSKKPPAQLNRPGRRPRLLR